jgi:outer membrane protein assembly factor BamB
MQKPLKTAALLTLLLVLAGCGAATSLSTPPTPTTTAAHPTPTALPPAPATAPALYTGGNGWSAFDLATGKPRWGESAGFKFSTETLWLSQNVLYSGDEHTYVTALNASDGSMRWQTHVSGSVIALTGDQHTLYVAASNGQVSALSEQSGALQWTVQVGSETDALTLDSSTLYVSGVDQSGAHGTITTLTASSGKQGWQFASSPTVRFSTPVLANGTLYATLAPIVPNQFSSGPGALVLLNAADGSLQKQIPLGTIKVAPSTPVIVNHLIYVADATHVSAFKAGSGALFWSQQKGTLEDSGPAVSGGLVFLGISGIAHDTGGIAAFDANSGAPRWSKTLSGQCGHVPLRPAAQSAAPQRPLAGAAWVGAPVALNGVVYVWVECTIYALDASTGAQRWTSDAGDDTPFLPLLLG